ncbi:winged helix-turn-helix transcriptional regulator [Protaetiibacter sp. SSC-01]|uniref:MarR family winged helix-turn-helix transcriptional regulator n=1 Tax=Protaetiibacter sp. SSC-01 TaxID=2759943 RepID=UPI001656FE9F|nr:MarR family winged helix-turn-helix transcriptional regulator [Protaetiibacter sp. SSC-01]QNO38371.1 winged helix-turn-helix transcriptional regulator [Protaetiibacter sp. SSC-01]
MQLIGQGIAVTLHELVYRIDGFAEELVREHFGISYSQYHFLAVTSTLDEPDVTTLAECLMVSKAAVSKRLDGLVKDGWIELGSDPHHARRVIVNLTPTAQRLVGDATAMLEREFAAALHELPAGETDELNERLRAILDIFIRKAETPPGS